MKALLLTGAAALVLGSASLALAAPEDLLPPSFGNPAPSAPPPAPVAPPAPGVVTPAPVMPPRPGAGPGPGQPVVQPLPNGGQAEGAGTAPPGGIALPEGFPSLAELEAMDTDELNRVLGLTPEFDIPPAARRAVDEVGVIALSEGGFAHYSLSSQPAGLVRAALLAADGPVVSRWGHMLMRRVLASRLDAPRGMDPVTFAALRARALNGMGESVVARALVQDVDSGNYNRALADSAFAAYLATGDILGMCPVARLQPELREDGAWELLQGICLAYLGEDRAADRRLQRALGLGLAPEIDVRLAQRYAGAGGEGRRAVNIEWEGVERLTPWRLGFARALGIELPAGLPLSPQLRLADAQVPATPILARIDAAGLAAERGVLSSQAMVSLYGRLYATEELGAEDKRPAADLRAAYAAARVADRIAALQRLWEGDHPYGRLVLTAHAAARIPPSDAVAEEAPRLIAAMLAAGLDRSAMRWAGVVEDGSVGWALLAVARPGGDPVDEGALDSFIDADGDGQRKARFLVAGLAGLGRLSDGDSAALAERLGVDFARRSPWSDKIARAAALGNPALVALLAGLGMQGDSWDRMTARQLYHVVRALDQVGLQAEARMIAAEAVARG